MSQPVVKYFAIARLIDNTILCTECTESKNTSSYTAEFKTVVKQLERVDLQPSERQKMRSPNGAWFITCDDRRIHYAVLADSVYPERHAYALVNEVIEQLKTLNDYYMESESTVSRHTKHYVPKLLEKYSDLKSVDKLYKANEQVETIRKSMAENINKVMVNTEDLNNLNDKTADFRDLAEDFYHDADEMSRITKRNKRAMIIAVGAVVTVIIAVLAIYVF